PWRRRAHPALGDRLPEVKQPFGTRAKQFTGDLAFGQMVTVKIRDIDRYKRTVAEVILPDGRNLNQKIVRAGLAWWYQQYAPVVGAAGSGAGGAGGEAWAVERTRSRWSLGSGRGAAAAARKLEREGESMFVTECHGFC